MPFSCKNYCQMPCQIACLITAITVFTSLSNPYCLPKNCLAVDTRLNSVLNLLVSVCSLSDTKSGLLQTDTYLELSNAKQLYSLQSFSIRLIGLTIRSSQSRISSGSSMCLKIFSPSPTWQLMYSSKLRLGWQYFLMKLGKILMYFHLPNSLLNHTAVCTTNLTLYIQSFSSRRNSHLSNPPLNLSLMLSGSPNLLRINLYDIVP